MVHFLLLVTMMVSHDTFAEPLDTTRTEGGKWAILPIVFTSPDTDFGIGVLPQYVFRTTPTSHASSVRLDAYYTQQHQFNLTARANIWLPHDRHQATGKAQFREWPNSFYGIGNTHIEGRRERYSETILEVSAAIQRRFGPGRYAGGLFKLRHSAMHERETGGMFDGGTLVGSVGGQAAGAGVYVSFDTREDVLYPLHGHLINVSSTLYVRLLGSDFAFAQHSVEARQWVHVTGSHVIAFQAVVRASTGSPPFQMLNGVGDVVRGYASKRYTDRHLLAVQAEYRAAPLLWRFGLVTFIGAGQVAHTLGDFGLKRFHIAYGLGLRFQIVRSENINVRWDFGFSRDSSGDYLDLNEAF